MTIRHYTGDYRATVLTDAGPSWTGIFVSKDQSGPNTPVSKLLRGELQENPYHMVYLAEKQSLITYEQKFFDEVRSHTATVQALCGGVGAAYPIWGPNDELALIAKAVDKIREHDFNMAIFLGESRQSLATIKEGAMGLVRSFRALKQRDFAGALRSLSRVPASSRNKAKLRMEAGDVSGAWLGLAYGWKPLINDVYQASLALEKHMGKPFKKAYRVSKTLVDSKPVAGDPRLTVGGSSTTRKAYKIIISEPLTIPQSIGVIDPLPLAWELLPYSFVVDWFIPIGRFLDNRAVVQSLKFDTVVSSFKSESRVVSGGYTPNPGDSVVSATTGGAYSKHAILFDRTISDRLNVPFPTYKPLEKIASWEHAASAVALLHQVFSRG